MIKNRNVQLIYRTIFLTISVFGIIESFGLFAGQTPSLECFLYYTSLSNFLAFGVMAIVWWHNYQQVKNGKTKGNNKVLIGLKFYTTIIILVTFIVYNFILVDNMFATGWNNLGNLTKHIVCPLMVVVDFIIFDKHHSLKWYDPLLSTVLPLVYVAFILIRGSILPADFKGTIYPYFFLDVSSIGLGGVFRWVAILLVAFIFIGYLFYLWDKVYFEDNKLKFEFKKKTVLDKVSD